MKKDYITVRDIRNSDLYWDLITRDSRKVYKEMETTMACKGGKKGKGTKKGGKGK
jgi:hypothetical protein